METLPPPDAADSTEQTDQTLFPHAINTPMQQQTLALIILAIIGTIFFLEWAEIFFISLLLGILFAYTLNPLVECLVYIKLPRVIGATLVMLTVMSLISISMYAVSGQMQTILDQLPKAATRLSTVANQWRHDHVDNMQKVQIVANEIAKVTNQVAPGAANRRTPNYVVVDSPTFKLNNLLWSGGSGVLAFFGQATMVAFLTYFLLLSGDTFKRKFVRLAGPTLARKKITVHILDDINNSIQNYMFMLLITNILLGLLTWGAFILLGLENAGAWAVLAGLLHIIPYFGPVITAGATGMAAFLQFNALTPALQIAGVSMMIAAIVGTLVTTWMTGRFAKMNTTAVFISLLFWTWLWGVWGMLLSIPIIVIVRAISQHIEQLHPLAELLGE